MDAGADDDAGADVTSLGFNRSRLVGITIALIVVATAVPVVLSLVLAREQARAEQERIATIYAADVLRRSEAAAGQIEAAFARLARMPDIDTCGPQVRDALQGFDTSMSYVQFIGVVRDNRIDCSSYGPQVPPVALGPADYISATGMNMRRDAELPYADADKRFIVVDNGRFAAVVHKQLPVDATIGQPGVALAVVSLRRGYLLASNGAFDPASRVGGNRLKPDQRRTLMVDGRTVAQHRSTRYALVAIASLDPRSYHTAMWRMARVMVPIGLAVGVLLAYWANRLARAQMTLAAAIRAGLLRDEFFVVYQPIVRLRDRRWAGAEVLVRWSRAGQMIRPDLFIAAAEEAQIVPMITARVFERVEPVLARLAGRDDDFFLSVNLSAQDLHRDETLAILHGVLQRTGIRPHQLHVEITERGFADTATARQMVQRMRELGVRVSIDDFGTGYSSLAELTTFDLDTLKIDKAFVDTVGSDAVTSHVAFHIVEMARGLSLEMVAEGVEEERQAAILADWRVPYGQGWLFSYPLPADEFLARLADAAPGSVVDAA